MQIFYKLKHIPTGLFFKPSAANYKKENLSKIGKVYQKKPSLSYIGRRFYIENKVLVDFVRDDWRIVKYTVLEEVVEE